MRRGNVSYLRYDEFVPFAPDTVGKVRVNHSSATCSGGRDCMVIERLDNGNLSAHCFRCGLSGYKMDSTINPYKHRSTESLPKRGLLKLPTDLIYNKEDFPVHAISYLFKSGVYDCPFIGWSESAQRIYFRLSQSEFLARSLDKDCPNKWIENIDDKYKHCLFENTISSLLIVVEDVVSALALNHLGISTLCLYGSSFTARHKAIINKYCTKFPPGEPPVLMVWLDDDTPTIKLAQANIANDLYSLINNVAILTSPYDPKIYAGMLTQDLRIELSKVTDAAMLNSSIVKARLTTSNNDSQLNNIEAVLQHEFPEFI